MMFFNMLSNSKTMSSQYDKVKISSRRFLKNFDRFFPEKVKRTPTGKALVEYVLYGYLNKGFLAAALNNNLIMSSILANEVERTYLVELAGFIHAHLPTECWGSEETQIKWAESGGLEKRIQAIPYHSGDMYDST